MTKIQDLSARIDVITLLAQWHFKQWGDLTGASIESDYEMLLSRNASTRNLPLTLIAVSGKRLLGSVNIVDCDMAIRSELKPWLVQLYVAVPERNRSIGSILVHTAIERCRKLGFRCLCLYASGTLPVFYERICWTRRETVHYEDKARIVMEMRLLD
jgi:GNAT superfamily N-acetyltransferase